MTEWNIDTRPENTRRFGDITLVSATHKRTRQTAHLITFPDGKQLRVLPDGSSGQRRSRLVSRALQDAERLRGPLVGADHALVETWLVGRLAQDGLEWEQVGNVREQTIEEWLTEWLSTSDPNLADALIDDLAADGWKIVRAE